MIKVIKRKDAEAMADAKTQSIGEPERAAPISQETAERRSRRARIAAVSDWIPDRKANNRFEEVTAVRKFFGSEHLLREI